MAKCSKCNRDDLKRLARSEPPTCDACYQREKRGSKASGPIRKYEERGPRTPPKNYHEQLTVEEAQERFLRKLFER